MIERMEEQKLEKPTSSKEAPEPTKGDRDKQGGVLRNDREAEKPADSNITSD